MPMKIHRSDIHLQNLRTRMPVKYGIATMTFAPMGFVRVEFEIDGQRAVGIAADLLAPKWFTKVPEQSIESEIDEMLRVIEHARKAAALIEAPSAFRFWQTLYDAQHAWGQQEKLPPLLTNFGTTFFERAAIEATCRRHQVTFAAAVRSNLLGIDLGQFDSRLAGTQPADWLPAAPLTSTIARHTIGPANPLTDADIVDAERLDDGLPQSLVACVRQYGLRHFKAKATGNVPQDVRNFSRIGEIASREAPADFVVTLDANEHFRSLTEFREYWTALRAAPELRDVLGHVLFVEQPFHRDVALDAGALGPMRDWPERPRMIIDESDAELDSLRRALDLGYVGTSHKNCKGIFKSIANSCLLAKLRRDNPGREYVMSGEDLANIGPVALQQDLAVMATLGIESVERNGHHFFAGLSQFPENIQRQTLEAHPDLYHASPRGWPTLTIRNGRLDLTSVNTAPFGVGCEIDVAALDREM